MKFSKAASYAITAAAQLSHDAGAHPIACSQLAQAGDMPERFLLQVMRHLVMEGICESTRGVDGGYRLARPASEINLAEIVEAIDGPFDVDVIDEIDGLAASSNRLVRETLASVTTFHRNKLAAIRLSSMKVVPAKKLAAAS